MIFQLDTHRRNVAPKYGEKQKRNKYIWWVTNFFKLISYLQLTEQNAIMEGEGIN